MASYLHSGNVGLLFPPLCLGTKPGSKFGSSGGGTECCVFPPVCSYSLLLPSLLVLPLLLIAFPSISSVHLLLLLLWKKKINNGKYEGRKFGW